jgi:hypothetical protein
VNYISTVSCQDLDKSIGLSYTISSFEEGGFDTSTGLEYQKLIFNTKKPSPENIASDIIAVLKNGTSAKIGSLIIFEGEKLKNYKVPINLVSLGKGKHSVMLKFVPNKELALQNARMRKIWDGAIKTEITFEIRKRKVKNMFEEQEKGVVVPEKKKEKTTTTIKAIEEKKEENKIEEKTEEKKEETPQPKPTTQPPAQPQPSPQPTTTQPPG